jgi:arsenite-transporting ATPase
VERLFEPMAILEAPLRPDEILGYEALLSHGEALFAGRDPRDVFGERPGLRFAREGDRGSLRLPMPGRDPSGVEVARIDDELVISVDGRRRQLPLPAGLHRMEVERVAVEGEELRVTFVTRPSETDSGRTAEAQTPSGIGGPA